MVTSHALPLMRYPSRLDSCDASSRRVTSHSLICTLASRYHGYLSRVTSHALPLTRYPPGSKHVTLAVDVVASGVLDPIRFERKTNIKIYKDTERFFLSSRFLSQQSYTVKLKPVSLEFVSIELIHTLPGKIVAGGGGHFRFENLPSFRLKLSRPLKISKGGW